MVTSASNMAVRGRGSIATSRAILTTAFTVAVLANLDAGHSNPGTIAHVVVGLVESPLLPEKLAAVASTSPEIAATLVKTRDQLVAGGDIRPANFRAADCADHRRHSEVRPAEPFEAVFGRQGYSRALLLSSFLWTSADSNSLLKNHI